MKRAVGNGGVSKSIEKRLAEVRLCWNCFRFVRWISMLGTALALLAMALGVAIYCGLVATKVQALTLLCILAGCAVLSLAAVFIAIGTSPPKRTWLAGVLESADRRLQDRLNTLLFLQGQPGPRQVQTAGVFARIVSQTDRVLNEGTRIFPFSPKSTLAWLAGFLVILGCCLWLNYHFAPWARLRGSSSRLASQQPEPLPQIAFQATNYVEPSHPWGEIRITDPGTDLKLAKADVVPLSIEVAANQDLKKTAWYSSVNGDEEQTHELPPSADPHYAAYQTTIRLDQLGLSDWDVMTYYARAATDPTNTFASEVYFIEIRPSYKDILKIPGGQNGQAYATLNGISFLIIRQQHVIRETQQYAQRPPPEEKDRELERGRLALAEGELGNAVEHLYAEMTGKMPNKPGDSLDNLSKAQGSLSAAGALLRNNALADAQNNERAALSELVAARKAFQKAVSARSGDFNQANPGEDVTSATSADSLKSLSAVAESSDESKSAREFVQKTLDQQKDLEQQTKSNRLEDGSELAQKEEGLVTNLNNFAEQHPGGFKGAEKESEHAQQAMKRTAALMREKAGAAAGAAHDATQRLEQLGSAMKGDADRQQLADAYRLRQMLDREIRAFDRLAKTNSDAKTSAEDLDSVTEAAQQTIDELKKNVDQQFAQRGDKGFGRPLRDALSGQAKADLDEKLSALRSAASDSDRRERAGVARAALEELGNAFDGSQPASLQEARRIDSLKLDPVEASVPVTGREDRPELIHVDPERLPSVYRSRIQTYFQKLSEK
jgi:hypothetical protein